MRFEKSFLFMALTVVSCVLSQPMPAHASDISPQELEQAAAAREDRVEEFQFIRQEANHLGVRVWLFGGTASSYLHYVKWDLQREKGDTRFQADRFDYDFTNIYRSTQDLDIVVDGNEMQINRLKDSLKKKYPHFLGNNTKWELRPLKESKGIPGQPGFEEALLGSFDFLNQDTDSNSTGMIEVTRFNNEPVIRDLRDWKTNEVSNFLRDTTLGKDTFYRSATHDQTTRAKIGENPEIFSVIRALTKAFQYDLTFSEHDWHEMQSIITQFNPSSISNPNAIRRLKDMAMKLYKHAVNLEYAWNTLEKIGLRQKLMAYDNLYEVKSLAWWMNKEPLRTYQLGTGEGKTAKELGLDIVAHEASDFLAYESITRAHTGDPNVFISRKKTEGESALYGNGFYVRTGREGAKGTGITIRFHLDPEAREGTDFTYTKGLGYLVIRNKAALKVIQESLHFTPLEYFQWLASDRQTERSEKAIYEKMRRRLNRDFNSISPAEEKQILEIVQSVLPPLPYQEHIPIEWFHLPMSLHYPNLVVGLLSGNQAARTFAFKEILSSAPWAGTPLWEKWVSEALRDGNSDFLITRFILSQPESAAHPEWVEQILNREAQRDARVYENLVKDVLNQPFWSKNAKWSSWVETLENKDLVSRDDFIAYLLSQKAVTAHPEWISKRISENGYSLLDSVLIGNVLKQKEISEMPEWSGWINTMRKKISENDCRFLIDNVMSLPAAAKHPEWLESYIPTNNAARLALLRGPLVQPEWRARPEWAHWMEELIQYKDVRAIALATALRMPEGIQHPAWMNMAVQGSENSLEILTALKTPEWMARPEWSHWVEQIVNHVVDAGTATRDHTLISQFLNDPKIAAHPKWPVWVNAVLTRGFADQRVDVDFFELPQTQSHPEWLHEMLLRTFTVHFAQYVAPKVLQLPAWKNRLDFVQLVIQRIPLSAPTDVLIGVQELLTSLKSVKTVREAAAYGDQLNQKLWHQWIFGKKTAPEADPTFANLKMALNNGFNLKMPSAIDTHAIDSKATAKLAVGLAHQVRCEMLFQ